MSRIQRIYWCDLPDTFAAPGYNAFALWPSPIGSDACFEKAGFTEFSDDYGDDQWDLEWREMIDYLLQSAWFGWNLTGNIW